MTDDSPYTPRSDAAGPPRRRRLHWRFVGGFTVVFVGMLLLMNQYYYTGDALVQCKLWQFYVLEVQRAFTSSGALGPTSGSGTQAFIVLLTHLVVSSVAGLISMGIGATVGRFRA